MRTGGRAKGTKDKKPRIRRTPEQIASEKKMKALAQQAQELVKEEIYDHVRIRKEARDRVPNALIVLDNIMHFDAFELRVKTEILEQIYALCRDRGYNELIEEIRELGEPKNTDHKTNPTITQMLDAAKIIFERAGDRPATAPPADDGVVSDYLVMDSSALPKIQ
jgi:hypothetical protein